MKDQKYHLKFGTERPPCRCSVDILIQGRFPFQMNLDTIDWSFCQYLGGGANGNMEEKKMNPW